MNDSDSSAPQQASKSYRIRTPIVQAATQDLPKDEREALMWLHRHCIEHDYPLDEVGRRLNKDGKGGYSRDSLYKALTGRRGNTSQTALVTSINEYRAAVEKLEEVDAPTFVKTGLVTRIWQICETSRIHHRPAFIYGPEQSGKTEALLSYARYGKGNTYYVRMPTGGRDMDFLRALAKAVNIPRLTNKGYSKSVLRTQIAESFGPDDLIQVDEAHQPFKFGWNPNAARSMDEIREVWDQVRIIHGRPCGLIICGTDVLREAISSKSSQFRAQLRELYKRKLLEFTLPTTPSTRELNDFARVYGLPPASDQAEPNQESPLALQTRIIDTEGLGVWCTKLEAGRAIATNYGEPMTWQHVLEAEDSLLYLASGDFTEEDEAA